MALPKQPGKPLAAPGMNSGLVFWLLRQDNPLKMQCPLLSPTDLSPEIEATFRRSHAKPPGQKVDDLALSRTRGSQNM